jgi:hypothetical protein
MKLGPLNSAIRAAPVVLIRSRIGSIAVQKTSLLDALKSTFTEGRGQETNLELTSDNHLEYEQ